MNLKQIIKSNFQQILYVFLAFLIMVLVSFFFVSSMVRRQMLEIGNEMMNTAETAVSAKLQESKVAFANMVYSIEDMLDKDASQEEIVTYLTAMNTYFLSDRSPLGDFLKVYGFIRGEFLDGSGWVPPADYYPPARPWYEGAVANHGQIFFSEPYIDADTGEICISYSQEVYDAQGNGRGIVAIDLNLSYISGYVRGMKLANGGYGIFISDSMSFAVHRDEDLIGKDMEDVSEDYARLASMIRAGEEIEAERFRDVDGVDSVAFFRTIFINGWHLGVVTPRADYFSQLTVLAVILGSIGSVLMIFLSIILVRSRVAKLRSDEESRSKSEFLSRMSHEIRTPMNAIIGMTDIARNADTMEKVQYCLDKISDASSLMLGVINDILDMSKIEAGKIELSEDSFDLRKMLHQITSVNHVKMADKQQEFAMQVAPEVPAQIVADQQRLAQVLTNLLGNANKFTPEGGHIRLAVSREPGGDGDCMLRFEVEDDGIGISAEQQSRLFRSFEQADGGISRKYGGTGLGLAISKSIVELMGGRIWVESEPGQGSRFLFTIRAGIDAEEQGAPSSDEPAGDDAPPEDMTERFAGKRVLLAEDVEINKEILVTLLEDTGVQIDWAKDGAEACGLFSQQGVRYDMIFMDVHMPEVDGYEATRRIRAMDLPDAETVPIIAMTANVFREDVEKCLAAGMNDHLGKPLVMADVYRKMIKYMENTA